MTTLAAATLSVAEAAELLGRHRTRIYALVRSGDLVAMPGTDADEQSLRIDRSSVERWAVAGGSRGGPLTPRHAWAIIGQRRPGFCRALPRAARAARGGVQNSCPTCPRGLVQLAPRLRGRALVTVLHPPPALLSRLEADEQVVLTGSSVARLYGWDELRRDHPWALDSYLRPGAVQILVDEVAAATASEGEGVPVLLRSVDGDWPFPSQCQLAPEPLAALDLLDYSDPVARRLGQEVLRSLAETERAVVTRRTARARATAGPLVGQLLRAARGRGPRQTVEGDPRTETRCRGEHRRRPVGNCQTGRHRQRTARSDWHDPRAAGSRPRVSTAGAAARADLSRVR